MASIQRVVFGVAATLLIVSFSGLSSLAQPAGRFSITYYYPIGDQCLRNTTGNVEIERDGVCINNRGSSNSAYKTCNSTHVQKWLCPQLNCLGQCTLENSTSHKIFRSTFGACLTAKCLVQHGYLAHALPEKSASV
jgi:hypothetical protein